MLCISWAKIPEHSRLESRKIIHNNWFHERIIFFWWNGLPKWRLSVPALFLLSHREHTVTGWRNTEDPTESCVILIPVWQTRRDFWRRVFFTRILVSWIKRWRERDQKENEKEKEKKEQGEKIILLSLLFCAPLLPFLIPFLLPLVSSFFHLFLFSLLSFFFVFFFLFSSPPFLNNLKCD